MMRRARVFLWPLLLVVTGCARDLRFVPVPAACRSRRSFSRIAARAEAFTAGDLALGGLFLGFCGAYLPQALGLNGRAWQAGNIRYFTNRGTAAFSEAARTLAEKHPGFQEDVVFTYFDTFQGELPYIGRPARLVQLISREVTDVYDHKRGLEERLREYNCASGPFAETYFSKEEALAASEGEEAVLFFAKAPGESGGRGIRVLRREEVLSADISSDYVLQRGVQDLELIDGRKFVVRFYLLVYDHRIYLHEMGVLIVHGARYDPTSVEDTVQVRHDWYDDASDTRLLLLQSVDEGPRWREAIAAQLRAAAPALAPLLAASSTSRYVVVGGDALLRSNGESKLIELNMYPNLFADRELVDDQVYKPLTEDILSLILFNQLSKRFEEIKHED
ncbi:unnamed protein product [Effrenium voratum]|nr:unnamed protein product [Effrenium voratum]